MGKDDVTHLQVTLYVLHRPEALSGAFTKEYQLTIDDCNGRARYLEHVHAIITLKYSRRGDIKITLRSPRGTSCVQCFCRRSHIS